jgi:hypothetical protein
VQDRALSPFHLGFENAPVNHWRVLVSVGS